MEEIFKPIEGFPKYYISNYGRVLSKKQHKDRIMKPYLDSGKKYYMIDLKANNVKSKCLVHRLVCKAFVDNPNGYDVVNHKDHNSLNNYYENLEWVTTRQNVHHSYSTMPAARNKRKTKLIFPDGSSMIFESYAAIARYHDEHNLNFSVLSLGRHHHSRGFVIEKF